MKKISVIIAITIVILAIFLSLLQIRDINPLPEKRPLKEIKYKGIIFEDKNEYPVTMTLFFENHIISESSTLIYDKYGGKIKLSGEKRAILLLFLR